MPGLRSSVRPYPHQARAAACIQQSGQTKFEGLILADPPGAGKTLAVLMAIAMTPREGYGPSVIVAPASCCQQWMDEIDKFFDEVSKFPLSFYVAADIRSPLQAVMPALCVVDMNVPLSQYFKYRVIVTSYQHVAAELGRVNRFSEAMRAYRRGEIALSEVPAMPWVTFLSGVWQEPGVKNGRYLVLDEAHSIKNTGSLTYQAVSTMRNNHKTCVMVTATPLENKGTDALALLSMLGKLGPITSATQLRLAFGPFKDRFAVLTGHYRTRFIQILDAVTLRRPLPAFGFGEVFTEVVHFNLTDEEAQASNDAFEKYREARRSRQSNSLKNRWAAWSELRRAEQESNHPKLVEITRKERNPFFADSDNDEDPGYDTDDDDGISIPPGWGDTLKGTENSWSSRVDTILAVIKRHRAARPDDAMLLIDDDVYFLDVLQYAIEDSEPMQIFLHHGYDARSARQDVMENFFEATGSRIMLASRSTTGSSLNIQCANVLIRCAPWWRKSWEERAEGRIRRIGQTKPVFIYELRARNGLLDKYKLETRDGDSCLMDTMRELEECDADAGLAREPRHMS